MERDKNDKRNENRGRTLDKLEDNNHEHNPTSKQGTKMRTTSLLDL